MSGIKNKTNLSADESLKIANLTLICSHHLLLLVIHQLTGFTGGTRHVDSQESPYFDVFKNLYFGENHGILTSILPSFRPEAVEDRLCHLYKNWLMKVKCPLLTNMPPQKNQKKISILLPLRTIYFRALQYETPCMYYYLFWFNLQ